ncbi:MAG: hypothetical protein IK031_04835 [Bacteroidales bacterium]|nr:hypothetical protein [Bacteroidales bacterium]
MDRFFRLLVPILLLCSCSVKENRGLCPCELHVGGSEPIKTEGGVLVSVIQDGTVVKQGMMGREDFDSGKCVLTVPRRPSVVTVFCGITDMNPTGGRRINILSGHECDELYSCSAFAEPSGDEADCTVTPHKNFARLDLAVIGLPDNALMRIEGRVHGYDLLSLDPCEGSFGCGPREGVNGVHWYMRLPRQLDDSLVLEILVGDAVVRTVPLGSIIAAGGYRYDDQDLLDIAVTVDLSKSEAMIHLSDWENGEYSTIDY